MIVLDPVNLPVMQAARERGIEDFVGGNCTVSLMLMAVWVAARGLGGMDHRDDLPVGLGSGRAEHARECSDQMGALHASRGRAARGIRPPTNVEMNHAVSPCLSGPRGFPAGAFRRAARGEPDPVDRQGPRQRPEPGRMEGGRRVEQDHGNRGRTRSDRGNLRTRERDALPLAGAHHQAQARRPARGGRAADRGRKFLGEDRTQRARCLGCGSSRLRR